MKTLSANLQNKLKLHSAWESYFIIKMVGSTNTYYLATKYGSITDSGTKQVLGLLATNPQIKESVDIKKAVSSVGGFSFQIVNDPHNPFSNNFATEYFYNREISIYLNIGNLTALSDCLLVYKGLFEDWQIDGDYITIKVTNNKISENALIPNSFITADDLPDAPDHPFGPRYNLINADILNQPKPIFYGDLPDKGFPYTTGAGTNTNLFVRDYAKIPTIKAFRATDVSGQIKLDSSLFYVAGHNLNNIDETQYNLWVWDSNNQWWALVDASDWSVKSNTYDGAIIEVNKDIVVYAYIFPTSITNSGFTNSDNANDGDWSTFANSIIVVYSDPPATEHTIDFEFDDFVSTLQDSDITEIVVYARHQKSITGTTFICRLNNTNDSLYTNVGTSDQTASYTSLHSGTTVADVMDTIQIQSQLQTADSAGVQNVKFYGLCKRIKYSLSDMDEFYLAASGRTDDGAGTITGTPEALIENPADIIKSLIVNDAGFPAATIDSTSFGASKTELASWKTYIYLSEQQNLKTVVENYCLAVKSLLYISSDGTFKLYTFKSSYTTDKTGITKNDIKNISVSKSDIKDVKSKYDLYYCKNAAASNYFSVIQRNNSTIEGDINLEQAQQGKTDYIEDPTTAGLLADHYCQNSGTAFWGMPRNIVEFETVDFRGESFWDGSTFEPLGALELFDIIELDHTEFDGYLKCNGESWEDKQFLIFEITRGLTTIKFKAVEL